jgi:catechol 2,3-dioxygenase-like lactoylglutathione lyase family enzyme
MPIPPRRTLRARGLESSDAADGLGRDERTGAERRWRSVFLPPSATRSVSMIVIEHRSPPDALPAAVPFAGDTAAVAACDHVVVQSANADASRALYGDVLGLRLALDRAFEDWGVRLMFFRTGHLTVEIAASLTQSDPSAPDRFWGISWRVPDIDAAHARLVAAGFDVSEIRTGRRPGTRVATVRAETHGVATLVIGSGFLTTTLPPAESRATPRVCEPECNALVPSSSAPSRSRSLATPAARRSSGRHPT